jgi:hypothetical protein
MLSTGIQSAQGFAIISFDGKAARWNTENSIQVEYDPDFGSEFTAAGCDRSDPCNTNGNTTINTAIKSSIKSWKDVSGLDLQIATPVAKNISQTPKYDGKNQIKFYPAGWQSLPFVPPSSALAVTITTYNEQGKILDADIFVNGEFFSWGVVNSDSESNVHDIANVITHEFGHFLGLDHTSESLSESNTDLLNATMFYASFPGQTSNRTLENHDVWGIRHLYTNESVSEPTVDEISPNQLQINYKGSATVEIYGDNFDVMTSVVLAVNSNDGDVVGRVVGVESGKITVSFDVSNLQTGEYDIVVANSFDHYTRIEKAMSIQNSTVIGTYNSDGGDSGGGGGCHSSSSSSLLLFLLPALLFLPRRVQI